MDPVLASVRRRLLDDYEGDGRWANHLGDATAWAPAYLLAAEDLAPREGEAAQATVGRQRRLLLKATSASVREEAGLGVLALVASARAGNRGDRALARTVLAAANATAAAQRGYLARPASTFDPSSVTFALAYANLLMAAGLRGPARIVHGRTAEWLLARVEAKAWEEKDAYYRGFPDERSLVALPNLLAIAALARASRMRRKGRLMERAERLEATLRQALFDREQGAWLASEAAEPTYLLSVQNFAALAYAELAAAEPREGRHRERGLEAVAFATRRLAGKDVLAHDWSPERGRAKWHCVGCNYQTLYVADLLERPRTRL